MPDSASVFTAETWAIIKALEEIKNASSSKYMFFTGILSCLQALLYMKLDHPLIGMVIRKCVLILKFANIDIICVGYPAILVLEVTKRQTLELPYARLVYPIMILNTVSQYILTT